MAQARTLEDLAGFARDGHFGGSTQPRVTLLRAPRSILLGQEFTLHWEVQNAGHVELWLGGAQRERRVVAAAGRWTLRPALPGLTLVELAVWGEADDAGTAPACIRTSRVAVQAPPVRVHLAQRELRGQPGSLVRLQWLAEGAVQVHILRPLSGEQLQVPHRGVVELALDHVEELVRVQATGHDGAVAAQAECRLLPASGGLLDIDAELRGALQPLEELQSWT